MDAVNLEYLEKIYETRPYKQNESVDKKSDSSVGGVSGIGSENNTSSNSNNSSGILNVVQTARKQAVYDTALSLGIKAGLQNQLNIINDGVEKNINQLDKVYNFEPYLIYSRVVPPIITEARNLYNQDGEDAVRLSGALYKIERKARIVSVAPNWREYLNFPKNINVLNTNPAIKPNSSEEASLWKKALHNGWKDGIEQANVMLKQAFDRLNRDFTGMIRFHRFVEEGKVTLPVLAASKMDMTKNASSLILNEELLRLTVQSDFAEQEAWKAKIIGHAKVTKDYSIIQKNSNKEDKKSSKKAVGSSESKSLLDER
ncbi:MAG: hypothetical protein RLZZ210_419 [Pseudomonadota bacterium]|jgi:defect-in-organelle-trafficking protein DotC